MGTRAHWHVPIDDTRHWKYHVTLRRPGAGDQRARTLRASPITPDYHLVRNGSNRYLQDRSEMNKTFSGMGEGVQAQDACVIEGAGPVMDRTREHLGYSDRAIIAARKLLLRAIREVQEGGEPAHVIRDPSANKPFMIAARQTIVPTSVGWRHFWEADPDDMKDHSRAIA